jgi:membrane associated rhomboid family serine protease
MIIIPVEKSIDWRKPPMATIALVICNVALFVWFSIQDNSLHTRALQQYEAQALPAMEIPAYEIYLQRRVRLQGSSDAELLLEIKEAQEEGNARWVSNYMLYDLDFVAYLVKDGPFFWHEDEYRSWLEKRQQINDRYLVYISGFAYGLLPGDTHLSDFATYQFLHADWWHLLGNMIFLFVIGFTVERALGAMRFVLAYLLCGMLSGQFYTLFSAEELVPLVGASGSISGLMGMYVALFGLQRIRFFYHFAIYFGYFSAPALAVLPVWLGKELIEFVFTRSSNVAFLAHIGGLLGGAGLVALFGKSYLQVKEDFHEVTEDESDEIFRNEYDIALKALARMEFANARERFRVLHQKYPSSFDILQHCYHLEKLLPSSETFAQVFTEMIDTCIKRGDLTILMKVYREGTTLSDKATTIDSSVATKVLYACIRQGELKDAELVFSHLRQQATPEMAREGCLLLVEAFKQRQQTMKVNQYQGVLKALP